MLEKCSLCPHNCNIDRTKGQIGRCKSTDKVKIALTSLHHFEEPCISGKDGSGTIFFSNCNLSCVYCQNHKISQEGTGREISIEELAESFIIQQNKHAENINLVTPTMYVPQIIEAIKLARKYGLKIPIIYNTNSYENIETIKMLKGYVDVYLPDLKYYNNSLSKKYSKVDNYFEVATKAILEMYYQVGLPKFDENGMIKSGVIIRHLILPNHLENTKNILMWIKENMPRRTYVSIMSQYFPTHKASEYPEISRKLNEEEYTEISKFLEEIHLENGYFQELEDNEEQYVPNF